jgi:hypothetical protein
MNSLRNFTILVFLSVFTLTQSCVKHPCSEIPCANGGNCDNGVCDCLDWYGGEFCQNEIRENMYGNYRGTISWDNFSEETNIYLDKYGDNLQKLLVDNSYYIELSSVSEFTIPSQEIDIHGTSATIQGSGIIQQSGILKFDYTLTIIGTTTSYHFNGIIY